MSGMVWRRMIAAPLGNARAAAAGSGNRFSSVIRIKGGRIELALRASAALASFARSTADGIK